MGLPARTERRTFARGTRVEVRSKFRHDWVHGFEIADAEVDGYRLRRLSDDAVLPVVFADDDVRLPGPGRVRRAPLPARLR
jgi:hypothetical protein